MILHYIIERQFRGNWTMLSSSKYSLPVKAQGFNMEAFKELRNAAVEFAREDMSDGAHLVLEFMEPDVPAMFELDLPEFISVRNETKFPDQQTADLTPYTFWFGSGMSFLDGAPGLANRHRVLFWFEKE